MSLESLRSLFNFRGISQRERMREIDLGACTIKSHGSKVARKHMYDWLILLLLGAIEIALFLTHPFHRFVAENMMTDLKYPMKDNTVPVWSVPMYAVLLPIAIFLFFYFRRRDVYDLHHSILGLLFAVLITGVFTDAIKVAVGRPRPNFFWRCFPDGIDLYDHWGDVVCHGKDSEIKEGYKSFPSGHTSWSFAGLGFLSLYLSGKIKAFDRKGHVAKLCVVFLPLLAASLVGISRIDDYWHHWEDVFVGGLLGLVVAAFCYGQFFPPPYHVDGWGPYSYFKALEDSGSRTNNGTQTTNAVNVQNQESVRVVNQEVSRRDEAYVSLSLHNEPNSPLDAMELGRR